MVLIKCSECGKEISDKAQCCVSCGAPVVLEKPVEKEISFKDSFPSKNSIKQILASRHFTQSENSFLGLFLYENNTFQLKVISEREEGADNLLCYFMIPSQFDLSDESYIGKCYRKLLYGYYIFLDVGSINYHIETEALESESYYLEKINNALDSLLTKNSVKHHKSEESSLSGFLFFGILMAFFGIIGFFSQVSKMEYSRAGIVQVGRAFSRELDDAIMLTQFIYYGSIVLFILGIMFIIGSLLSDKR